MFVAHSVSSQLCLLASVGTACGTSSSTRTVTVTKTRTVTTTTAAPPTDGSTVGGGTAISSTTPRCHTSQLGFTFATNGAAGSILIVGTLHNHSQAACSLFGYPGIGLLGKDGSSLPANVERSRGSVLPPGVTEHAVVLKPGGAAEFFASFSDVGNSACPVAAKLQVTPPNAYSHLTVAFGFSPVRRERSMSRRCSRPACSNPRRHASG